MVWTSQRLFMASYYGAHLARLDPSCPWHPGARPDDNPRFLGPRKDPPLLFQRPYGRATDRRSQTHDSRPRSELSRSCGRQLLPLREAVRTGWLFLFRQRPAAHAIPTLTLPPEGADDFQRQKKEGEPSRHESASAFIKARAAGHSRAGSCARASTETSSEYPPAFRTRKKGAKSQGSAAGGATILAGGDGDVTQELYMRGQIVGGLAVLEHSARAASNRAAGRSGITNPPTVHSRKS